MSNTTKQDIDQMDLNCVEYYDEPTSSEIQTVSKKKHETTMTITDIIFIACAILIGGIFIFMIVHIYQNM